MLKPDQTALFHESQTSNGYVMFDSAFDDTGRKASARERVMPPHPCELEALALNAVQASGRIVAETDTVACYEVAAARLGVAEGGWSPVCPSTSTES